MPGKPSVKKMQKSKTGAEKTERRNQTNCSNGQVVGNAKKETKGSTTTAPRNSSSTEATTIITRSAATEAARACVVPSSSTGHSKVATVSLSVPSLRLPSCYVSLEKLPAASTESESVNNSNSPGESNSSASPSIVIPSSSSSSSNNLTASSNQKQSEAAITANSMNFEDNCVNIDPSSPPRGYGGIMIMTDKETTAATSESTQTKNDKRPVPKEFEKVSFCKTPSGDVPIICGSSTAKRSRLDEFETLLPSSDSECAIIRIDPNGSITSVKVPVSEDGIDAFAFSYLMQLSEKEASQTPKVLILDCRNAESFNLRRRINFSPCVNVDIAQIFAAAPPEYKFPTRVSVIKFFQRTCSKVLRYLNTPDHYAGIIVLDEKSTTNESSAVIRVVIAAITKWTENTKTIVKLLEGGIQSMYRAYPDKFITLEAQKSAKDLETLSAAAGEGEPAEAHPIAQEVKKYLGYYDSAIDLSKNIIDLRKQLTCLENVKRVLLQEQKQKLSLELDAQFPKDCKCSTCTKVFTGEIIQCANGHCICAECCQKISVCPECKISYYSVGVSVGKVRNRGLEGLMKNTLSVKCHCGKNLKCNEISSHVNECVNGLLLIDEIYKIKGEIELVKREIDVELGKLGQVRKLIADAENKWCATNDYNGLHSKIGPNERKPIMEKIQEKQICFSTLKTRLLSLAFFDEEHIQEKKGDMKNESTKTTTEVVCFRNK